ncbi:MAG: hypothetical protein ISP90_03990 [Nevskia sp.]|nr:hypothetical protein [Nevskia sp.]
MSAMFRRLSLGLAASLLAASAGAGADSANLYSNADAGPSPEAVTADLVVVRPLGVAATVIGTGIFLVGLPFEAVTGNFSGPARTLIGGPAKYTFQRPIGEMK